MLKVRNRWQAFGIHLGISFLIFLVLLAFIIFVWFPGVFINLGGYQGIKIVAGVDLVLGPLLTLIVFNPTKKSLKFDLSAIAFIQVSALLAGTWIVYQERPIYQIASYDGVYIVAQADLAHIKNYDLPDLDFGTSKPIAVYMDLPLNAPEIESIRFTTEFTESIPLHYRLDLFRPLKDIETETKLFITERYKYEKIKNCYLTPIHSKHQKDNLCFSFESGIMTL